MHYSYTVGYTNLFLLNCDRDCPKLDCGLAISHKSKTISYQKNLSAALFTGFILLQNDFVAQMVPGAFLPRFNLCPGMATYYFTEGKS